MWRHHAAQNCAIKRQPSRTSWRTFAKRILVSKKSLKCLIQFLKWVSSFFSVAKIKFKKTQRKRLIGRKTKSVYKLWRGTREEMKKFQKPKLHLETNDECCSDWIKSHSKKTRFLVMGKKPKNQSEGLVPTFILPWSRDKVSKNTEFLKKILQLIYFLINSRRWNVPGECSSKWIAIIFQIWMKVKPEETDGNNEDFRKSKEGKGIGSINI